MFNRLPDSLSVPITYLKNFSVSVGECSLYGIYDATKPLHYCLFDKLKVLRVFHFLNVLTLALTFGKFVTKHHKRYYLREMKVD